MTPRAETRTQLGGDGRDAGSHASSDPSDYGALNAAYLALLAAVVAATSRRRGVETAIPAREILPLSIATFALAKVVAKEKIGTWVREPFVEEDAERRPGPPRGRGLRHAVGELLTCTRCIGAWAALALVGMRLLSPPAGRIAVTVLATSGTNDFLQAAFKLTTERANEAGG